VKKHRLSCFARRQFLLSFLAMTATVLMDYVGELSGTFIAGRMVGEMGLSAINLLQPFWKAASFLSYLCTCGLVFMVGEAMGRFDEEAANKYFSMSLLMSVAVGVLMFAVSSIVFPLYLRSMHLPQELSDLATQYFGTQRFAILMLPLVRIVIESCYTDGDSSQLILGYSSCFVINILASILFTRLIGIAGVGLGLFLGYASELLICAVHFLKKTNSLHFHWYFSWKAAKQFVAYAMTDAIIHLCLMAITLVLNYWVVFRFGSEYLPVLSVVFFALELTIVFDSISQAFTPIASIYLGEESYSNENTLIWYSLAIALAEGALMMILLFVFAPAIIGLMDIQTQELFRYCVISIRILAFSMPLISSFMILTSQFVLVNRFDLSVRLTVIKDFLSIAVFTILLSCLFGIIGIMVGILVSYGTFLGITLLYLRRHHKGQTFPWLAPLPICPEFTCGYQVREKDIIQAVAQAHEFMVQEKVERATMQRVDLLLEELSMLLKDKNPESKHLLMEYSIFVREQEVQVIIKDSGEPLDLTVEGDALQNFRAYFVANMMAASTYEHRQYLMTMGFNRSRFVFPRTA